MSVKAQSLKSSKFEENAIRKQDEAYKVSFAKRSFEYSCELCCSRNLRASGTCSNCPIKEAHIRALTRIASEGEKRTEGKPMKQNYEVSRSVNKRTGNIHITFVMHYD